MFAMQIQMNEEKILREDVINLSKVYAFLDKLFADNSLVVGDVEQDGTRNYHGTESGRDFGRFCIVNNRLRAQAWFVPNCSKWIWGDNEQIPGVWDYDDVLEFTLKRETSL